MRERMKLISGAQKAAPAKDDVTFQNYFFVDSTFIATLVIVVSQLISVVIGLFVISRIYRRLLANEEKKRLTIQLSSPNNAFAKEASRNFRAKGWLKDGSLSGVSLRGANLQREYLSGANLKASDMVGANLQDADLRGANLQNATLNDAMLEDAYLTYTNLQEADLSGANLHNAYLTGANLKNANLSGANLTNASLKRATLDGCRFSTSTILPDGSQWSEDRDLGQFTMPQEWQKPTANIPATKKDKDL
ncbi:hypothetical protein MASR2M15_16220 [Anaerolineales bacterium]